MAKTVLGPIFVIVCHGTDGPFPSHNFTHNTWHTREAAERTLTEHQGSLSDWKYTIEKFEHSAQ